MKRMLFVLMVLIYFPLMAQFNGSEWIDFSKPHLKFKHDKDQLVRIDFFAVEGGLFQLGTAIQSIPFSSYRIFSSGQQVPILVTDVNSNNTWDPADYIEFVAHKNDGKFDSLLFDDKNYQRHQLQSFYTDFRAYYLTYRTGGTQLRYTDVSGTTPSPNPTKKSHEAIVSKFGDDIYFNGKSILLGSQEAEFSDYREGEGFYGPSLTTPTRSVPGGTEKDSTIPMYTLPIPAPNIDLTGFNPSISIGTVNTVAYYSFLSHWLIYKVSPDGSSVPRRIGDTMTTGNVHVVQNLKLNHGDFGAQGITLQLFNAELPSYPKFFTPGYGFSHYILKYPKIYDLNQKFKYNYIEDKNNVPVNINWKNYSDGTFISPLLFDEDNQMFIKPAFNSITKEISYTLPTRNKNGAVFITDLADLKRVNAKEMTLVKWPNYATHINNTDFIIISDSAFIDVDKTLEEYVSFKQASFSNPVRLLFDDNLYDAFSYGIEHPMAIRNYCKYLLDNGTTIKPKYLFIIGRGFEPVYNRGFNLISSQAHQERNFIPMMGYPASDNMLTAGLDGTVDEPAISTGRFPADNINELKEYLRKQIQYASNSNQYADWRKNTLHLGGGIDGDQAQRIGSRLSRLGTYVTQVPNAGRLTQYSKSASDPNSPLIKANSIKLINTGVNLITFLGHGSSSTTDIDIGRPTDYVNVGKYPIFYFNGCQIGNPGKAVPISSIGFSNEVIKGTQKGGIAFLAQSSLSELYTVLDQMDKVYNQMFTNPSGNVIGIGDAVRFGIKDFQRSTGLNRIHCQQLLLQGDPSTPLYRPELPDFSVNNSSAYVFPTNTNALSDSFSIAVVVTNLGKGVMDSFDIEITRTFDYTSKRIYSKRVRLTKITDTFFVVIKSKDSKTKGPNIFDIEINKTENPIEFTYSNNSLKYNYDMPGNGINLVYPKKFDIIHTKSVSLIAQPADLFRELYGFFIEIDTTPSFSSPYLRRVNGLQPLQAGVLAKWDIADLNPQKDTQDYFWRARLSTGVQNGGDWIISSFTYIKDHQPGWMQNNAFQYVGPTSNNISQGVKTDTLRKSLFFEPIAKRLFLDADYGYFSRMGVKESGFGSQDLNFGIGQYMPGGLVLMAWDAKKLERIPLDTNLIKPAGYWGGRWKTGLGYHFEDYQIYYGFNMSIGSEQDKFINVIDNLPDSTYVTLFTYVGSSADQWKPEVLDALHKIGGGIMDSIGRRTNDAVYLAIGKKGWPAGKARENVGLGGYTQLEGDILGEGFQGTMTSENIGPVDTFYKIYYSQTINKTGIEDDSIWIDVQGIDNNGKVQLLKTGTSSPIDISGINTKQYPFINLVANFKDRGAHTPGNLINWRVTHSNVPDGSLYPLISAGYKFRADSLIEGDTFMTVIPFKNISNVDFKDSLDLVYELSNKDNRAVLLTGTFKIKPLKADSLYYFNYRYPTKGLEGTYGFNISINGNNKVPEKTLLNNSNTLTFVVVKDVINPLLDVTFDSRHIMDGDIVSANPIINISSIDENKFLLQNDPTKMTLELQEPGKTTFTTINWGGEATFFPASDKNNKARAEYKPQSLQTGTYSLRVQSQDASNNLAGKTEYIISFNVDRNQTVTQFYPYPNPVTSTMRFVFTLTGENIPDDIRIKIANSSGRIVKEVNRAELGNIHVGNNITDSAWDGRDQFGDMLANGPYFYTVTVKDNGENVKLRETKGDGSFKNQTGVIYLLR